MFESTQFSHDEEALPLLAVSEEQPSQSSGLASKLLLVITASAAFLTIGFMNSQPLNSIADSTTQLVSTPDVFWDKLYKETALADDGSIVALDRHLINCETDPLHGFRLHAEDGKIQYKYDCYQHFERRLGAWGYNTGFQETGGIIYLERQKVLCPDNTFLNAFSGQSLNADTDDPSFTYNFICSKYKVDNFQCETYTTNWHDDGSSHTLTSLSSHDVTCPDNSGLRGFEGESKSCGWWCTVFRYKYTCCKASSVQPTFSPTHAPLAEPSMHPTKEPTLSPFIPPLPKGFSEADRKEFIEEIVIDEAPVVPDIDTPKEVIIVDPSIEPSGVLSKAESPLSPAVSEYKEEVKEEMKQDPIAQPTMSPTMKKALYCPKKFKKNDADFVPSGCALFASNDIGWDEFKETSAVYVCADAAVGVTKLTATVLKNYGFSDKLSIAKPGDDVTISLFSGNLSGEKHDMTSHNYIPLTHFKFKNDKIANDDVKSVILTSKSESTYAKCSDLYDDIKTYIHDMKKK